MKAAAWFVAFAVLAFVMVTRALGPSVDSDAPVEVLTADPVRVLLPVDPDATDIKQRLTTAIQQAANAESGTLANELERLAADSDRLQAMADTGASRFSSNQAAALAYPLYATRIQEDGSVTITAITAELVPQHRGVGYSIQHEDGHAYINDALATGCGRTVVADKAGSGLRGRLLENSVVNALHEIGDEAHDLYHQAVNYAPIPRYRASAREAAEAVISRRC
jgi:hypothetical protein